MADLASRQHGVVAHRQLLRLGLSPSAIQRRVRAGWLHPLHLGVYAVGHPAVGYLGRWMGGVLACGEAAVLSHHPAGALLDLRSFSGAAVHVTVPGRTRRGPSGLTVHRVRHLHADDCTVRKGIPVTSVARTILDLAETLKLRQLIRVIEQAERLRAFDLNAIHALIERSRGRHGLRPLIQALEAVGDQPPRVNSDWERDLLDFCDDHGIPRPELNVIVEGYEVDAFWRDLRLIVELDSWAFHRFRRAFEADRAKICALQLAGYRVLPLTKLDAEAARILSAATAAR